MVFGEIGGLTPLFIRGGFTGCGSGYHSRFYPPILLVSKAVKPLDFCACFCSTPLVLLGLQAEKE